MTKWLQQRFKGHMVRPIFYRILARSLWALTIAQLWNRFVDTRGLVPLSHAFTVIGMGFLALAWFNYLHLDGIAIFLLLPVAQLVLLAALAG
ncbi:MAG: hypothetical protein ACOX3V_05535 [Bacillota bacterium]|jgi:hypothetical protein